MTRTDGAGVLTQNQCLYLSLAAAVRPQRAEIHDTAGTLRLQIEAAVRRARPQWEERDLLGQEVGAFADLLTWGLSAAPTLRERAVAVYDARTGGCEVFRPPGRNPDTTPVAALWFSGAHYRWVRWREPGPTLAQLLTAHAQPGPGQPRVLTVTIQSAGQATHLAAAARREAAAPAATTCTASPRPTASTGRRSWTAPTI